MKDMHLFIHQFNILYIGNIKCDAGQAFCFHYAPP